MENDNNDIENIREYDFDTLNVLKEGVERIEGIKQPFLLAFSIYVGIYILLYLVLNMIFPSSQGNPNVLNQFIVSILSYPVMVPILAGIMMMAINYYRDMIETLNIQYIFNYYQFAGRLAIATLLMNIMLVLIPLLIMLFPMIILNLIGIGPETAPILMIIGMFILLGCIIYLSVAYLFTLPLIIDKGLGAWSAMELSRKTVAKHWFKVAGLIVPIITIFLFGLLLINAGFIWVVIPFGIGLIWAVPLIFVTLYGLAYPIMFED